MIIKLVLLVVLISLITTGLSYLGVIKEKNKAKRRHYKRSHKKN